MAYLGGIDDVFMTDPNTGQRQRVSYRIPTDAQGNAPATVTINGIRYAVRSTVKKKRGLFGKIAGLAKGAIKIGSGFVPGGNVAAGVVGLGDTLNLGRRAVRIHRRFPRSI